MDHFNSFPVTKTSSCFLLSLLAFSLQLLILFETTFSFSFVGSHNSSSANCLHHEKFALLQLKHGFLIDRGMYNSSSKLDSWNPATSCCSWEGITCDEATGHVIGLDLCERWVWIEGEIDSSLFSLHSLQKLNLSWNNFFPHPIPSGLGHLTNLTHLNLSYSGFTGQIPLEISRLTKLVSLDLSDDHYEPALLKLENPNLTTLIGNLSSLQELFLDNVNISGEHGGKWAQAISIAMPNLRRLSLHDCGLQGPIDSSLFRIPDLSQLSLDGNNLSSIVVPDLLGVSSALTSLTLRDCGLYGEFPQSTFLMSNLQKLDVSYNPHLIIDFSKFPQNKALQKLYLDGQDIHEKLLDSLSNLKSLKVLSLHNCNFSGLSPSSIAKLTQLEYLDLSSNNFGGMVPSSILNLTQLEYLDLSTNNFGGMVPSSISSLTQLEHLDLSSNSFGGMVPSSISNLTKLQYLHLSSNNFGGMVPSSISNLTKLQHLHLSSNNFSGTIPSSIAKLTQLEHLDLSSNNFGGMVPSSISNLTQLEDLGLSSNNFGGMVPSSISNLAKLQHLHLSSNNFGGMVPSSISNLTKLQYLYLSSNNFSGTIPSSIAKLTQLEDLDLSSNNFSGTVHSSIANLTQLEYLDLSSNNFSGTIPSSYADGLKHLISLDLIYNSLEGSIPPSLFSHPTLQYLDLSYNQFSGYLPDSHNESSLVLERIYLNNNKLQGTIPRLVFELTKLRSLSLSNNNFSGTIALDMFKNFRNFSDLDLSDNGLSIINNNSSPHLIPSSQMLGLYLRSCNISEFPNILQNLDQLGDLDLSKNKIHGEIPAWIWEVGNGSLYQLNLSNNFFESFEHPLPEFSSSSLKVIDLHSNRLRGSLPILPYQVLFHDYSNNSLSSIIPATINFTSTRYFFLSGNNVSGEIPSSICKARLLEVLDLSRNNLSGNIPTCLGEIGNSLEILNLQRNAFQGTVPDTFKKECSLRTLNLDSNELEGPIPKSLANCKTLEVLDLGNNRLNDTFPFWFDSFSNLRILILRSNKFHGPIAHSHAKNSSFQFLQIFDISSNSFVGIVPPDFFLNWKLMTGGGGSDSSSNNQVVKYQYRYGLYYQDSVMVTMKGLDLEVVKIITALTSVDLSNNRFEGEIPKSICNLKLLHVLNFSQNEFTGPISALLENLTQLESLDFSRNKLSGTIPWQLTKLTFLEVLNLSQNLLHGRIPQSQQFLTFTNSSFLGNNGLCGLPLSTKCEDTMATPPSTFSSFGLARVEEIDLEFMWMGFGLGVVFGFGVIFWTLALWRRGSRKYMQLIDRMFVYNFSMIASYVHR